MKKENRKRAWQLVVRLHKKIDEAIAKGDWRRSVEWQKRLDKLNRYMDKHGL